MRAPTTLIKKSASLVAVVVNSEQLAVVFRLLVSPFKVRINVARPLCRLDDHKVARHDAEIDTPLITCNIDSV